MAFLDDILKLLAKSWSNTSPYLHKVKADNMFIEVRGNKISIPALLACMELSGYRKEIKELGHLLIKHDNLSNCRSETLAWEASCGITRKPKPCIDATKIEVIPNTRMKQMTDCFDASGLFATEQLFQILIDARYNMLAHGKPKGVVVGNESIVAFSCFALEQGINFPNLWIFISSLIVYWAKRCVPMYILLQSLNKVKYSTKKISLLKEGMSYEDWCYTIFDKDVADLYVGLASIFSPYTLPKDILQISDVFINDTLYKMDSMFYRLTFGEYTKQDETNLALIISDAKNLASLGSSYKEDAVTFIRNRYNNPDALYEDNDYDSSSKSNAEIVGDALRDAIENKLGHKISKETFSQDDLERTIRSMVDVMDTNADWVKSREEKLSNGVEHLFDYDFPSKGYRPDIFKTLNRRKIYLSWSGSFAAEVGFSDEDKVPVYWLLHGYAKDRVLAFSLCFSIPVATQASAMGYNALAYMGILDLNEVGPEEPYTETFNTDSLFYIWQKISIQNKFMSELYCEMLGKQEKREVTLRSRIGTLEGHVDTYKDKLDKARADRKEAHKKAEELKKQLKSIRDTESKLEKVREAKEYEEQIRSLETQVKRLDTELNSAYSSAESHRKVASIVKTELDNKDIEIASLREEVEQLRDEVTTRKGQIIQSEINSYISDLGVQPFINLIKDKKVIVCGGDMVFSRLRSYGLDNIKTYGASKKTYSRQDVIGYDLVVICTSYAAHSGVYGISNICKSNNIPLLFVANKNPDILIYKIFGHFYGSGEK